MLCLLLIDLASLHTMCDIQNNSLPTRQNRLCGLLTLPLDVMIYQHYHLIIIWLPANCCDLECVRVWRQFYICHDFLTDQMFFWSSWPCSSLQSPCVSFCFLVRKGVVTFDLSPSKLCHCWECVLHKCCDLFYSESDLIYKTNKWDFYDCFIVYTKFLPMSCA